MGLMATINLIAIVAMSSTVVKLTRDYFAQRKAGKEPVFHAADYPELGDGINREIWSR
jgi:AGCS family alanine or glycine:cation symporter